MSDEKISLQVKIADRSYPLKIDWKDEQKILTASKLINEKIDQYGERYKYKDMQDFLAMAALQFVTKSIEFETRHDIAFVQDSLKNLNDKLSIFLERETDDEK